MSLKMKLTSAIIMFVLAITTLVIGVLAAESQTISMKGNVSFNINDRSLYLKSVRYKVGNDATEPVTLENFLPGYIDANMEVNIGDHEFNYSAFTLYFDIVNTTTNTYNAVEEVTLSQELSSQGVTASASGKISPTQETDSDGDSYAEIIPTSEPTGTITLTITSTSTQAINLGDITITIEQYIRNFTEEGFTISGNSITGYTGSATDLVLPAYYTTDESENLIEATASTGTPITSITTRAFRDNTTLISITIPDGVTSIGNEAFFGCTSLHTVDFGTNSQLQTIGAGAFRDCSSLTTITIPETVTSIGSSAFYGCRSLQTVDFGTNRQLQTIGDYAFRSCSSLTTITIPEKVTSIKSYAFQFCYALAIVHNNSSTLTITAGSDDNGGVGQYAKEVVTKGQANGEILINQVQYYVNGSTKIALAPAVARDTLTSVTLATDTTEINQYAFFLCSSLTTITIPQTVTSIGNSAFSACYALAIVYNNSTTLTITAGDGGDGDVGYYAKEVVTNGQANGEIVIDNQVQYYVNGGTKIALAPAVARNTSTSVTLASDTTEITPYIFNDCTNLQTINFNNCQITSIPDYAFGDCSSLTKITIPKTVTSIEMAAFYNCSSLTTITIPDKVTSIGNSAFYSCSSLTTVIIEGSDIYESAIRTSACGYLLNRAHTVKVPTSIVSRYDNSFLEGLSSTTEMIGDVEYTVFTI